MPLASTGTASRPPLSLPVRRRSTSSSSWFPLRTTSPFTQEFLKTTSNEKAYLFIVVNKFERIRDKKKCHPRTDQGSQSPNIRRRRRPRSLCRFRSTTNPPSEDESFRNLESALRTFVLTKGAKSKLQPASTYLTRLLSDVNVLVSANAIVAKSDATKAEEDLKKSRLLLEKVTKGREATDEALEVIEEKGTRTAISNAKAKLTEALEDVARGAPSVKLPTYPGVLGIWEWVGEVRRTMLSSLDLRTRGRGFLRLSEYRREVRGWSADKDIMSVGLGDGVCVGSPVNRRTFMAVGRKQIEGTLTSKTSRC